MATLDCTTTDGRLTLRIAGEVDIVGVEELREQLPPATFEGAEVLLDLTDVELLDSTGLAFLLSLARDVRGGGGELETVGPHGSEGRLVIDMAGVGDILRLRDA